MTLEKNAIIELRKELTECSRMYWQEHVSPITDKEYDEKYRELQTLEAKNPDMFDGNSITQRVGFIPLKEFRKVVREKPMLSLNNAFSEDEINKYLSKVGNVECVGQPKIDGLAVEIEYVNGEYTRASTRGDGITGEDVTKQVKTIRNVVLRLKDNIDISIRGEVVLPKNEFVEANELRAKEGKEAYVNPRNAASGALRNLDPRETSKIKLAFIGYGVGEKYNCENIKSEIELVSMIEGLGFTIPPTGLSGGDAGVLAKKIAVDKAEIKDSYDYWTDGYVIKVNSFEKQKELGEGNRFPNWAIAYKFDTEKANTTVLDITLQVGRTGAITPVFELEPVFVSGTVVKRATAANFELLEKKDVRIGDTVEIHKAGEIIPEVIRVIHPKTVEIHKAGETIPEAIRVIHPEGERTTERFKTPTVCPSCSQPVEKTDEVVLRCTYDLCPAQLSRQIAHFVSRDAINIKGIGPVLAENIVESGLVKYPIDIFGLTQEQWCSLPRVGTKTAEKIMKNIEDAKSQTSEKLLYSLGGRQVGRTTSKLLVSAFGDFYSVLKAKPEEMMEISGVGKEISSKAYELFTSDAVAEFLKSMEKYGITPISTTKPEKKIVDSKWKDKTIVITGKLEGFTRRVLTEKLEEMGAKVTGSVGSKTDILIAGKKAGSKLEKAKALGIEVINESDLKL